MSGQKFLYCLSIAGCVAFAGCSDKSGQTAVSQPTSVEVLTLVSTNYQGYVEIVGNMESPATVTFQAQVSGNLLNVSAREGLMVKSNDLLFEIDSATYEASREAAVAQLEKDQASAAKADADLVRGADLLKQEVISDAQYDVYDASAKEAKAEVALSEAKLKSADIDLGYTKIRAPFTGLMGEILIRPGNLVRSGDTQLGSMNVVDPMWVTFSLSERVYLLSTQDGTFESSSKFLEEDRVNTNDWGYLELISADGSIYGEKGRVFFVDRAFSSATGTLKVKASFPNPKGYLKPNQFAKVRIPKKAYTNVFVIPAEAVLQMQTKSMVYVLDAENKVQMRPLNVLHSANNELVVDGFKGGERVVTKGLLKLRDGMKVNPMSASEVETLSKKVSNEAETKIKELRHTGEEQGGDAAAQ